MSKANIKITGTLCRMPQLTSKGDAALIFRTQQAEGLEDSQQIFESFIRVLVKKKLWSHVAKEIKEATYYIIEGIPKASTSNNTSFISVYCTSIKVVNGLKKDDNESDYNTFLNGIPEDTEEIIPISSVNIDKNRITSTRAKSSALNYYKKYGRFERAIVVNKETMNIVSGHGNYLVAKDLNIDYVPVSYSNIAGKIPKYEKYFTKYVEWYKHEEVAQIDVKNIVLTEDVHLNVLNFVFRINLKEYSESKEITTPIAVKPLENGKYSLIIGAARYFAAKILDIPRIPAVITDMGRDEFVKARLSKINNNDGDGGVTKKPNNVQGEILLSLINIPRAFLATRPHPSKIKETIEYYKKHGEFDKPVVIKGDNNLLVDGYKRYVAAKEMNLTSIWAIKRK